MSWIRYRVRVSEMTRQRRRQTGRNAWRSARPNWVARSLMRTALHRFKTSPAFRDALKRWRKLKEVTH